MISGNVHIVPYWLSTNQAVHLSAKNTVQGAATQVRPILIHAVMTACI
jgi:hypothetical protein